MSENIADPFRVEIDWEGKKEVVVFKKLTFGERNSVLRKALGGGKIKQFSEESSMIEVDPFDMREELLLKSIKEAPFEHKSVEDIRNIPAEIADILVEQAEKINPFRSIV